MTQDDPEITDAMLAAGRLTLDRRRGPLDARKLVRAIFTAMSRVQAKERAAAKASHRNPPPPWGW